MNRIFAFISLFFVFLFSSCQPGYFTGIWDYDYINNSSVPVTFAIGDEQYSLAAGENITITQEHSLEYELLYKPRVIGKTDCVKTHTLYNVYFEDMSYTNMKFFNFSNYDIIVTEKSGMLGDNYNDILLIQAGETVISKVYTNNPNFNAVFKDTLTSANNALSVGIVY